MNTLSAHLRFLWQQKRNIATLIRGDFTQNYLASYLGFIWAILGPLITLLVLTAVFQIGFRVPPLDDGGTPFSFWLACGMIPWLYFADGLANGASTLSAYGFLIRKTMFKVGLLPAIRLAAVSVIHAALIGFLLILCVYYQVTPSLYWLQIFIYFGLMYVLLLGISWVTSAVSIFVPDLTNVIGVLINLGFWATPIFWNPSMLPTKYHWFFTINPAYYIVQGYRDAFILHRWIWERNPAETLCFFFWLFGAFFLGIFTFRKLRPHFADVI